MGAGPVAPPESEEELLERCCDIAGLSVAELARRLGQAMPRESRRGKGFAGQLVEAALGASAGSRAEPDFLGLGVELKTVPVVAGRPAESTYVSVVPLVHERAPRWEDSGVRRKLARVLWLPVEAPPERGVAERRIGRGVLWSPTPAEEQAIRSDWEEHMDRVVLGEAGRITAHDGACLQVRPKAADARSRRWGVGPDGTPVRTLPLGFYLRPDFTARILERLYARAR